MATDMHASNPDGTDGRDVTDGLDGLDDLDAEAEAARDRWQRAWSHREHLLKVARRRSMSMEDAEDAVHEAMLRAAEHPHLDDERLGAWLTTVTMRLCVDRYRQVNREAEVRSSPTLIAPGPAPVDEVVCDRAEAKWLAVRSGELPARQAEALWLKSEDLDVGQVAVKMGLSYRTVESLLARARRTLRNSLAGTLGLALWLWERGRPRAVGNAQVVGAASTAATLVVAGFVLPYAHDEERPAVSPATSQAAEVWPGDGPAGPPAADTSAGPTTAPTPGVTAPSGGVPVPPLLPEAALPSLPRLPAPAVPAVPTVPEVPEVLDVQDLPDVPDVPDVPAVPEGSVPSVVRTPPSAPVSLPDPQDASVELPAGGPAS
ncbi:sigma-70 family RNA polymerase sigma factor [Streptomyces sp. MS1.AVA.4]|uniref:Sigma-70 family RNA polymerase sigma factor n=1 Tax=Streptomyces pratisoli TaxID=3139917 RepID=A0ACC6QR28_9ACTN